MHPIEKKLEDVELQAENRLLLNDRKLLDKYGILMTAIESDCPLLSDEDYHIPNVLVILCEEGTASFDYDFIPVDIQRHDIMLGLPGHIIRMRKVSDNYRIRVLIASDDLCSKARNINLSLYNKTYGYKDDKPVCHLSDAQFAQMNNAFDMLRTASIVGNMWREDMMVYSFLTIIMLIHEFHPEKEDIDRKKSSSLSASFQDAVTKHYRESIDVDFYASMFHLTPKYFSTLLKSEMGMTPKQWIDQYVALQAKSMLLRRKDLNIQQIAYLMGFSEQSSFTRFFKKFVGVTPTEYRNS